MTDREALRERLREVAETLFRERGAAAVGMREIAAAAGVAVGTLYNCFQDKDDLLAAVQARARQEVARRLALERLNPGRPLAGRVRGLVSVALGHAPLFLHPEDLASLLQTVLNWAVDEAVRVGDLPGAIRDRAASELALSLAGAAVAVARGGNWGRGPAAERLAALFTEGLDTYLALAARQHSLSEGSSGPAAAAPTGS